MVCLQSFCLEFLLLFLLSCFSSDMVCLQRGFLFLFCSFLVNFTNLSWKEFNIILILSIYWVELLLGFFFFSCFFLSYSCLFCFCLVPGVGVGRWGTLAFMKKTGVWGRIILTIYVLVYYILFFHFLQVQLWLLSLNVMCCGLQLVLWFHLLALLNLGSRLQGFIWRSADKVPVWK